MNMAFVATSIAKNVLRRTVWNLFSGRTNLGMDGLPQIKNETLRALQALLDGTGAKVEGGSLLELGVGRTPDMMMAFMLCGAKEVKGLDIDLWMADDTLTAERLEGVAKLLSEMDRQGFLAGFKMGPLEEELARVRRHVSYAQYGGARIPLPENSLDLIYSKSVLEHVRMMQVADQLKSQFQVLKPGGLVCHIIDLRDHMHIKGDWNERGDWLEALRYSEGIHNIMTDRRPAYINRIRAGGWKDQFLAAGFEIVKWNPRSRPLPGNFDIARLHPDFRDPEEDFSVAWVDVVARKP